MWHAIIVDIYKDDRQTAYKYAAVNAINLQRKLITFVYIFDTFAIAYF